MKSPVLGGDQHLLIFPAGKTTEKSDPTNSAGHKSAGCGRATNDNQRDDGTGREMAGICIGYEGINTT